MNDLQIIVVAGLALAILALIVGNIATRLRPGMIFVSIFLVGATALFVLGFIVPWYWYLLAVGAGLAAEGVDRVTKRLAGEDFAATRSDEAEGPTATAT